MTSIASMAALVAALALAQDGGTEAEPERPPNNETVVTATRTPQRADEVTVPTEVITRRDIEASGARDLAELMELHPGMDVTRTDPIRTTGVRMLGLDPEYVLVLMDGERIPGRYGGTFDLDRISLREVERIEIVKGPASVLYGSDAMAGVINLITRRPQRPLEGSGRASYGGRGELDLRAGVGSALSWGSAGLGGSFRSGAGFDLDPSDVATTGNEISAWDVDAAFAARPAPSLDLDVHARYEYRDVYGVDGSPSGALFDRRNRGESFAATGHAVWRHGDDGALTLRANAGLYRDQFMQDQRLARDLDLYQDARERELQAGLQLDRRLLERHLATAGLDALDETLTSPRLATGSGRRQRLALYLQDDWRALDQPRLGVTAGVRVDLDSQFGVNPSPRVAVRYDALRGLALRASLGWGFRAPSFQELLLRFENPGVGYIVEGNPGLGPERSRGLSLSADWHATDALIFSANLFRVDLDGLISVVTLQEATPDTPTRFGYENVSRAYTQGLEASARMRVLPSVWIDLGYALTDSRDLDTGFPLEGRAIHRGTARVTMRYRRFNLEGSAGGSITGPRPFLDPANPTSLTWTRPHANVDARVGWRPWPFLGVFVFGTNLLGAGNPVNLPLAPRGLHAGVEGTL